MADRPMTNQTPTAPGPLVLGLREKIGMRLLRPYLARVRWHYATVAQTHPDPQNRHNCDYIAIGLTYAMEPRAIDQARVFRTRRDRRRWLTRVLNDAR